MRPHTSSRAIKAAILAAGNSLTKLAGLMSAVILARYLDKADYSTYRQTLLAYGTAAPFLGLGLPRALYYFLPGDTARPGGVLLENFLLLSLMGLVFMLGLWVGGAELLALRFNNPDLSPALTLFAPFAFFMLPQAAFTACMMARERVREVALTLPLTKLIMVAAVVTTALLWQGPKGAIVGAVVGAGLAYIPIVYLMLRACRGGVWNVSGAGMLAQLRYSVPVGAAAMVGTTAGNIDKLLVSSMGTPEQFALYVNGAMKLPLVGIITGSVVSVLLPDMARHYKAGRYEDAIRIWKRAGAKCAMILIPTGVFLVGASRDLMALLFSETYRESGVPFAFYALLLPLSSISFGTPLIAAGRTTLALFESIGSLALNLGLTIVAIQAFGVNAAAAATVITSYSWAAVFNTMLIHKTYKVPLTSMFAAKRLVAISAASATAALSFVLLLLPIDSALLRVLSCGCAFFLILGFIYNRTGLIAPGEAMRKLKIRLGHRK